MAELSKKVAQQNRLEGNLLEKRLAAIEKSRLLMLRQMDASTTQMHRWAYRLSLQVLKYTELGALHASHHRQASATTPVTVVYCTCSRCLEHWQKTKQWTTQLDGDLEQQGARVAVPSTRSYMKCVSQPNAASPKQTLEQSRTPLIGLPVLVEPVTRLSGQNNCQHNTCTTCSMYPLWKALSTGAQDLLEPSPELSTCTCSSKGVIGRVSSQEQDVKSDAEKSSGLVSRQSSQDDGHMMSYQAMITVANKGSRHVSNTSFRATQMARKIQASKKLMRPIRPQTMPPIRLAQSRLTTTGHSH